MEIEFFNRIENFKNLETGKNFKSLKGKTKAIIITKSKWSDEHRKKNEYEVLNENDLKESFKFGMANNKQNM